MAVGGRVDTEEEDIWSVVTSGRSRSRGRHGSGWSEEGRGPTRERCWRKETWDEAWDIVWNAGSHGSNARQPKYTVLFFHSSCGSPKEVWHYVPLLWQAGLEQADVRVVAPCAPHRVDDKGWTGHSWFNWTTDHCWQGYEDQLEYDQLVEQRQRVLHILEEEQRRLPPDGRIILGGLSQGVAMALDVMLHAPCHIKSIAGVWCCRGMMQKETLFSLPAEKIRMRATTVSIFVFHGWADQTVPCSLARQSYRRLLKQGFQVEELYARRVAHGRDSELENRSVAEFVAKAFMGTRMFRESCARDCGHLRGADPCDWRLLIKDTAALRPVSTVAEAA